MRFRSATLACAVLLAAGVEPAPAQAPPPSPEQIFLRAFERLQSYPVPPYAVWTDTRETDASAMDPGGASGTTVSMIRYAVRTSDGAENYTLMPVPSDRVPPAGIGPQFQGPFGWSLRSARTPPSGTPAPMQPDIPAPLQTIARVTVYAKPNYAIGIAGTETIDGHRTYHLQLRPLSDPGKHNLRELWVDVATFDLWKAHFDSTYAPDPSTMASPSDVTVFFAPVAAYWIVSRMVWTWQDIDASTSMLFKSWTDQITFPSTLPDWIFDPHAYSQHQRAGDPDYLGQTLRGRPIGVATPTPSPTP